MKRDARLRGLSDDHHQALVLARRAIRAAQDTLREQTESWELVQERFATELEPHFEIEEERLLPQIEDLGEHALAQRVRMEHREIRDWIQASTEPLDVRLEHFGNALRKHVRFEERELFPVCERLLDSDSLEAVALAWRQAQNNRSVKP